MKTTDFTQMTNDEINAMMEQKGEQIHSLLESCKATINEHIKTLLPNWQVTHMNDGCIEVGFCITNKPQEIYQTVSIYFGRRLCEKEFEFSINPCCFGSFTIDKPSKQTTYYIGIGKMLSDVEFTKKLRSILFDFYTANTKLMNELFEIRREECRRKDEEVKKFKAEELKRKVNETTINLTKYEYVLIQKDTEEIQSDLRYRNHPCRSLRFGTEFEMHELLNTEYRKSVVRNRLKVVPVSKVRIANI